MPAEGGGRRFTAWDGQSKRQYGRGSRAGVVIGGAALGASTGLIVGLTGVAIGAAAGGGLGLIIGIVGGA